MLTNPSSAEDGPVAPRFIQPVADGKRSFTQELYGGNHPRQTEPPAGANIRSSAPGPPGSQVHRWWHPARCATAPTDAATTGRYAEATDDVGDDCGVGIELSHLGDLPIEVGPLLGGTDSAATDNSGLLNCRR